MGGGYGGIAVREPRERCAVRDCGGIVGERARHAEPRRVRLWPAAMGLRLPHADHGLGRTADGVLASVGRDVRMVRERAPADRDGAAAAGACAAAAVLVVLARVAASCALASLLL